MAERQDMGAPLRGRAGGPTDLSRDASQPKALIPCATCSGTGDRRELIDWCAGATRVGDCEVCDGRGSYTMAQLFSEEKPK